MPGATEFKWRDFVNNTGVHGLSSDLFLHTISNVRSELPTSRDRTALQFLEEQINNQTCFDANSKRRTLPSELDDSPSLYENLNLALCNLDDHRNVVPEPSEPSEPVGLSGVSIPNIVTIIQAHTEPVDEEDWTEMSSPWQLYIKGCRAYYKKHRIHSADPYTEIFKQFASALERFIYRTTGPVVWNFPASCRLMIDEMK